MADAATAAANLVIGNRMIAAVEARARALGAAEIALDTAVPATHLVDPARLPVRRVCPVGHTNYRTLTLSKRLDPEETSIS